MALERGAFQFGVATFPITDSTDNSLLEDADPAIFHALALLSSAFSTYFGARLLSQAALNNYRLPSAVVMTAAFDPTPYLLADQFKFPLFCLYRQKDVWDEQTITADRSTSTWQFAYVLPPLTPVQARELQPILRSASVTLRRVLHMGWDPAFRSGQDVWATAGIQKARLIDATYGGYERIDVLDQFYRALTGTITVLERERPLLTAFDDFDGADIAIDERAVDGTALPGLIDAATHGPPTITSLSVTTGSASGATATTMTGTGFRVGTRPRVLFDGAAADHVTVVSATSITLLTPPHVAQPTFIADVTIIAADGQSATLAAAFTFTNP